MFITGHVERKVPKYEYHKIRERKVKTYQKLKRSLKDRHTETVSRYFDTLVTPSLLYVHKHLLSSD